MARHCLDLHDWHNVTDVDGVKVWYMRSSLEKAIENLSVNVKEQTGVLHKMHEGSKDHSRDLGDLKDINKDIKEAVGRIERESA
jgi:SH3-like domain-containing protein